LKNARASLFLLLVGEKGVPPKKACSTQIIFYQRNRNGEGGEPQFFSCKNTEGEER